MSSSYGRLAAIRDYWMPRNLNARVEVRVTDIDEILRELVRVTTLAAERAAPTPPAQDDECAPDPWHAAIDNELVCCHILNESNHNDPRKALQDIINWHVQVALDPAVSSDAQVLIERGKQDDEVLEVLNKCALALEDFAYHGKADEWWVALKDARALLTKRGAA